MQLDLLKNLTVIDASTVLAGPSVGTFFAELGATVLKIEHPKHGDVTRDWRLQIEPEDSVSAYFSSVNYLKSYQKLDLTNEVDRATFYTLISTADILLTNFKKGDAEKFQCSDEQLRNVNPQLIHGKITGFGADSDRVAYDLVLQAETGFMSMNGTADSGPVKIPVAVIDILAAHHLKEGLLLALYQRQLLQKGATIEVSLYNAALASLANQASNFLMTGQVPKRQGSVHPNIAPYGELFKTISGDLITFAIGSDVHFSKLCSLLELNEIPNQSRFNTNTHRLANRIELAALLSEKISQLQTQFILDACEKLFIPAAKIKQLDEVLNDVKAQKLVRTETINQTSTQRITSIAFNYD